MPSGDICNYRREWTEREKVTRMLSIFPEILVSYFLMPPPPALVPSKHFFKELIQNSILT